MMATDNKEWLTFEDKGLLHPKAKTKLWLVLANETELLGTVQWYAPWRRYAFYPLAGTVFEQDCLRRIADFVTDQTKAHKINRRKKS